MTAHFIIFIWALVGAAESLYLNYEHRKKRPLVCVIGNDCGKVWASPYSRTFGVPNEVLGIIFYVAMAIIEASIFLGDRSQLMAIGEYVVLFGGAASSMYFTYLQWRVIKAWCFWCTVSALIVLVMVIVRALF
jgi:uncharacterized membrane protein